MLQACENQPDISAPNRPPAVQQWLNLVGQDDTQFAAPDAPQFPEDLKTHPQVRAESFSVKAILAIGDIPVLSSSGLKIGLIAQLDRVALVNESRVKRDDSAWRYSGVMRLTTLTDTTVNLQPGQADARESDNTLVRQLAAWSDEGQRQAIQRVALDLAGGTADSLWLGDERLTIEMAQNTVNDCERRYRWELALSATDRAELEIPISACPQGQAFGNFNNWQQPSAALTGRIITRRTGFENISTPVTGVAWTAQSWGDLPAAGGAVAIDVLQVRLDDSRWLNVSRSKRRSGRGPRTVSASLHTDGAEPEDVLLSWSDSGEKVISETGLAYPASIQLRSEDNSLDLTATIMNQLSESSGPGDVRLDVPVILSGSQSGSGFLTFNALPISLQE